MARNIIKITLLLCLAAVFGMQSCVDRVSVPEDNDGKLFINCEMISGAEEVTATLATSTNFNGTRPISNPTEANIVINLGGENVDDRIQLKYDEDRELYYNDDVHSAFWQLGNGKYLLTASVPNNEYPEVTASVERLPSGGVSTISTVGTALLSEEGKTQKEIEIVLEQPKIRPAYYYLELTEAVTVEETNTEGELVLTSSGESLPVTVNAVTVGGAGLIALAHKPGILIDQSRLTDNAFTLLVTSPHAIQSNEQVFKKVSVAVHSVDKNYYDFHKAYSNTISSTNEQYIDPAIWSNNINEGVGLFSINTVANQSIIISE